MTIAIDQRFIIKTLLLKAGKIHIIEIEKVTLNMLGIYLRQTLKDSLSFGNNKMKKITMQIKNIKEMTILTQTNSRKRVPRILH